MPSHILWGDAWEVAVRLNRTFLRTVGSARARNSGSAVEVFTRAYYTLRSKHGIYYNTMILSSNARICLHREEANSAIHQLFIRSLPTCTGTTNWNYMQLFEDRIVT